MSEGKRKSPIGRLDTAGGIKSEMGKVYRQMRREEIKLGVGKSLVWCLAAMLRAEEIVTLEARLVALESMKVGMPPEWERFARNHTPPKLVHDA